MAATDPAVLGREHWPGRLAQMRQALELQLRQQSWSDAQRVVDSARRAYPDTAFAAFLGGILELARGNPDAAETQLSESLAASPRSPVILAALAKTWSRRKGASFAGDQALRVAERDPAFAFARYLAARAYMDGHDPARAEAALKGGLVGQAASAGSLSTPGELLRRARLNRRRRGRLPAGRPALSGGRRAADEPGEARRRSGQRLRGDPGLRGHPLPATRSGPRRVPSGLAARLVRKGRTAVTAVATDPSGPAGRLALRPGPSGCARMDSRSSRRTGARPRAAPGRGQGRAGRAEHPLSPRRGLREGEPDRARPRRAEGGPGLGAGHSPSGSTPSACSARARPIRTRSQQRAVQRRSRTAIRAAAGTSAW